MRRLIFAALLSTTALVGSADRAHAGPVAAFVGGFLNALGAGTFLSSAAFVGAWSAGFTAASWLAGGSLLARVVVSVGLSALAQGLMPKPRMPQPAEAQANYAQDVTFCDFVYGEVRKGGPYAFSAFSSLGASASGMDARARRHYGVMIAAHPTEGPVTHYLRDWEVDVAEAVTVTALAEVDAIEAAAVTLGITTYFPPNPAAIQRVLLTAQADARQNGIWQWVPGSPWSFPPVDPQWIRPADFGPASVYGYVSVTGPGASTVGLPSSATWYADLTGITIGADAQTWTRAAPQEPGTVTTEPISGCCRIRTYTGGAGQAADQIWRAVFPEVTAGHDFAGLSYAALYADRVGGDKASTVYPEGREWVYAPVWRGENRILDPRTGLRGWTNNAALVIADIATRWYGKTVDWDEVAAEAEICDQTVTNRDGGTQKRWTINTVILGNMTWEETRAHLMMCCDAWFYERRDGKLGFKVGAYSEPTLTLTDADFSEVNLKHKSTGVDDVYSYAMRYVEPARDWAQEVTGAVVVGSNPASGRDELECYGIDSHNQAWRAVYRWAKSARPEWRLSGTLKYIGREAMEHRFVRVQLAELGVDAVFEVATLARNGGSHSWSLDAVSVEAADFAPDALTLEPTRPVRVVVAEDGTIPPVSALAGAVVEGTGGIAQIEWTWPEQTDDLTQRLRVRQDGGEWQEISVPAGQSSYLMTGLRDGSTYEAQIRNVTGAGRLSLWAPENPVSIEAIANTTPPAAMSYFSAMLTGSSVALSWTAPNSASYAAARIYRATGSTSFSAALLISLESGAPNMTDEWIDAAPGVGAHSYWIQPINGSGIGGPVSGPQTITIS